MISEIYDLDAGLELHQRTAYRYLEGRNVVDRDPLGFGD